MGASQNMQELLQVPAMVATLAAEQLTVDPSHFWAALNSVGRNVPGDVEGTAGDSAFSATASGSAFGGTAGPRSCGLKISQGLKSYIKTENPEALKAPCFTRFALAAPETAKP